MSNIFLYRMPSGIPGALNRLENCTVEPQIVDATYPPTTFGIPVKMVAGKIRVVAASDAASVVRGFIVRPYPQQAINTTGDGFAQGAPSLVKPCDIMVRGYMTVVCNSGTAAKDGAVYVRIYNASGAKVIGGIEAAAVSGETVAITNCKFVGPADADGNVEIAYNI